MAKLLNITSHIYQPPYASAIIFELRESTNKQNDYYIQVYWKNNTANEQINFESKTIYGK